VAVDVVAADWTAERMAAQGFGSGGATVEAVSRLGERVRVRVREEAWTGPVVKHLLAIGSGGRTAVVVATAPATDVALSEALEAALATAEFDPAAADVLADLPFRFSTHGGLAVAARAGGLVLLTEGGSLGKGPDEPMVTIGVFPVEQPPEDVAAFARARLGDLPQLAETEIVAEGPVGAGWELVAAATRGADRGPCAVYLLATAGTAECLVVTGLVSAAGAEWLEVFRAVGRSVQWGAG
jgi:hypothetical protein